MRDVVVRLTEAEAEKVADLIEGTISIHGSGPANCTACRHAAKLRAALDSPPVEERVTYRVFEDFGEFERIVRIEGGEYTDSRSEAKRAAGVAETYAEVPVRIQQRTTTQLSDGSELISPWTDLESEEG